MSRQNTQGAASAPTHEPRSRPSFRERVHMLAGHGTFREPQGTGTADARRQIPADHLVAAALSFGRQHPGDVGPDIAFDMATGRPGHWRRVCEWLGGELSGDRSAACVRLRPWAAHVAVGAYNAVVRGWQPGPAPEGVAERDWGETMLFACLLLERAAEDALALAARKARRVA